MGRGILHRDSAVLRGETVVIEERHLAIDSLPGRQPVKIDILLLVWSVLGASPELVFLAATYGIL